jgi:hypothetical protein
MMPNVEIALTNNGWGGDFQVDATGDLVLVQDANNNPAATTQRVYRMLMTSPRQVDPDTGDPVSIPDDLFAPGYGGGLRVHVGKMITPGLIGEIESDIEAGLQTEDTIDNSQPPSVAITRPANNLLQIALECDTVTGEVVSVPSFPLLLSGS